MRDSIQGSGTQPISSSFLFTTRKLNQCKWVSPLGTVHTVKVQTNPSFLAKFLSIFSKNTIVVEGKKLKLSLTNIPDKNYQKTVLTAFKAIKKNSSQLIKSHLSDQDLQALNTPYTNKKNEDLPKETPSIDHTILETLTTQAKEHGGSTALQYINPTTGARQKRLRRD